jgi:hypothetical protein
MACLYYVPLTETQRKAAIVSSFQYGREPRDLEDWLEAQPQRFVMLGILLTLTTQLCGLLSKSRTDSYT